MKCFPTLWVGLGVAEGKGQEKEIRKELLPLDY